MRRNTQAYHQLPGARSLRRRNSKTGWMENWRGHGRLWIRKYQAAEAAASSALLVTMPTVPASDDWGQPGTELPGSSVWLASGASGVRLYWRTPYLRKRFSHFFMSEYVSSCFLSTANMRISFRCLSNT